MSHLQVVELDGPLFCLSWCKRKRWLLVGGKAQLHVYSVCSAVPPPGPQEQLHLWPAHAAHGLQSVKIRFSCVHSQLQRKETAETLAPQQLKIVPDSLPQACILATGA